MSKNFLIIDTSGDDGFVALHLSNSSLRSEFLQPPKCSHAIIPAIRKLLKGYEIAFIAIGIGPGSFTGTRVGVMTAKALGFACALPLIPFCSLQRFLPDRDGPFTIAVKAQSHSCYLLKGSRKGNEISFERPIMQKMVAPKPSSTNLPALANLLLKKFRMGEARFCHEIYENYICTS